MQFKSTIFSLVSTATLSLGLSLTAGATTVTVGGAAPAGYTSTTFGPGDSATPGTWTFHTGSATANTSVGNQYLDPLSNNSYYAYAKGGSSITVDYANGISALDLLWGSPDSYNTITFTNSHGASVSFTPGQGLLSALTPTGTNAGSQMVDFVASPGTVWDSVTFSSTTNAFEFAEVSTLAAPTPEPATMALLAGGLVALGVIRRRKSV